jgi:hypothetical protein
VLNLQGKIRSLLLLEPRDGVSRLTWHLTAAARGSLPKILSISFPLAKERSGQPTDFGISPPLRGSIASDKEKGK